MFKREPIDQQAALWDEFPGIVEISAIALAAEENHTV
jgi:hypothetical protein